MSQNDDCVSRQAVLDMVAAWTYNFCDLEDEWAALKEIRDLPSAQPEQKKGKWIKHPEQKNIYGGKCIECSECGEKYMVQYIEDEKYCRNCGSYNGGDEE